MAEAIATAARACPQRKLATIPFLVQVSRPGLWMTTALFFLVPLGNGAFWHSTLFWVGLFYVLLPLGLLLYGTNDIVDAQTDSLNPRKGSFLFGSRGVSEQLRALRWQIPAAQLPFWILFYVLLGPKILWWIALILVAVTVYNAPFFAWKGRPPFDVLIQASYLLIFVLSSWLNHVAQLPWQTFLFGALFAMHSHIFGEVMDIEPDRTSGRRTTATVIGRVNSKMLMIVFLLIEARLISVYFGDRAIATFLVLGALWFAVDALLVWKKEPYSPKQMRLFMVGWNAAAILGIAWNWTANSLTTLHPVASIRP